MEEDPVITISKEEDLVQIKENWDRLEIEEINISKILEKLNNIKFNKLEVLSINKAGIKNLDFLINENFKSLIILELKENNITSLDQISKVPFSDLKILDLSNNQISSIDHIEKAPFKSLEILVLSNNNIQDKEKEKGLKSITDGSFTKITKLDLSGNKIESISSLADHDTLLNIESLYLNDNTISDISILSKEVFKNLKDLQISNNKIEDLKVFENAQFTGLTELLLYGNEIKFISSLTKPNFENLKILSIGRNKIDNIDTLKNAKFKNLERLDLFDNQILDISILKEVPFASSIIELDLSFNSIKSVDILLEKENIFKNLKDLKFEGNKNLDYGKDIILEIYKKYNIKYTYESVI
jgi:Leucine-rich repeat (LRR) protein